MEPARGLVVGSLFHRLEVVDDPKPRSAAFNMAADESLLEHLGEAPVLRIYRWQQPAISFGYFTRFGHLRQPGGRCELVRRWTGGGVVEHGLDFTYSLIVPQRDLAAVGPPVRAYELIHYTLAGAHFVAGIQVRPIRSDIPLPDNAQISPEHTGRPNGPETHCFEHPVTHDLMVGDQKAAGAAQRRTRHGLLHQGSVQGVGGAISAPADWQARLAASLPQALCSSPVPRLLTPAEEETALQLAQTKYATLAWLRRF